MIIDGRHHAFFDSEDEAKRHALSSLNDGQSVVIERYCDDPRIPMTAIRYDSGINDWVETSCP